MTKWGTNRDLALEVWLTILVEEVGELARAILEQKPTAMEEMRSETIQIAAVAVAFLETLDREMEIEMKIQRAISTFELEGFTVTRKTAENALARATAAKRGRKEWACCR